MFDTLCALPLTSELFSLSLHPSSPLLAVGLASGHVQTFQLPTTSSATSPPPTGSESSSTESSSTKKSSIRRSSTSSNPGTSLIETAWRTRRHKGSCRSTAFSPDGSLLYSAGTDGLIKCARTESGRVEAKLAVPDLPNGKDDQPCLVHPLTPREFLLATDAGALHLYDTREPSSSAAGSAADIWSGSKSRPAQTWRPHEDYITSLTALPPSAASTSGFPRQFVTVGDTTCALLDVRKGVIATSSPGKEVLTSTAEIGGRVFTGDTGGGLTVWDKNVVRQWEHGMGKQRVDVRRSMVSPEGDVLEMPAPEDETIDVLCGMPGALAGRSGKDADLLIAGWDTGRIEVLTTAAKGRRARVEAMWQCDETEGVMALGFDVVGRLVAGAGEKIELYGYKGEEVVESEGDEDEMEDSDDDSAAVPAPTKRAPDSEDEDDDDDDEVDSSDEERKQPKRKKRKKVKQVKGKGAQQTFSFAGLD